MTKRVAELIFFDKLDYSVNLQITVFFIHVIFTLVVISPGIFVSEDYGMYYCLYIFTYFNFSFERLLVL